ncbi:MAG: class I SAM-dependent methyltransferase [Aquabacterium sp.]
MPPSDATQVQWPHPDGRLIEARWQSEAGAKAPSRWQVVDDTTPADAAYKLACEGTGLVWQGDFQNARHLLQALTRRLDKQAERAGRVRGPAQPEATPAQAFHQHRQQLGHRARILGMLLIPVEAHHHIALRRAPDLHLACEEAYGPFDAPYLVSLRELLGINGAHEWRKKGVAIEALRGRIHAHYGVFSPVRGEYVDLVAKAPLPAGAQSAFDVGTGTGVLSAVLARRGLQVIGTDQDPRALACAQDNITRLGLGDRVRIVQADLFPPGTADLVVCNPPWVPAKPSSPIEYAVYDPDSRMLRGYLAGLGAHLSPQGEGWLILSDLAEHLGLRSRDELLQWIAGAGLRVAGRQDVRPHHPKVQDRSDPLHRARAAEVTSLWRLVKAA